MPMWTSILAFSLGLPVLVTVVAVAGWLGGWSHAQRQMRYKNPQLHEGVWHPPYRTDHDTRWRNRIAPQNEAVARELRNGTHQHSVALCTLTDALAHEDHCWCGARRYGVFGSWTEKQDEPR